MEHVASDHVTIILPDIHPDDMQWLLDFMYTGSVAVPKRRLSSFLQAAEALRIKILTDMAQVQKTADSDRIACSRALDFKQTNDANLGKHLTHSDTNPYNIKPYNLTEGSKHSPCNADFKITGHSSRPVTSREECKTVMQSSESCMFTCYLEVPSSMPKGIRSPTRGNSVPRKEALNTPSLYDGMPKRARIYEGSKGKGEEPSRTGPAAVVSGCDTKMIRTAEEETNASLGQASETALAHLQSSGHKKSPFDPRNVAGNSNSSHNPNVCTGDQTAVNKLQEGRGCKGTVTPRAENFCSSGYGLKVNNDSATLNSVSSEYRHKAGAIDFLSRNQPEDAEDCTLYPQRLPQWPKPLPSLMPIGNNNNNNNNTRYNGLLSACFIGKDCALNGALTHMAVPGDRKGTLPEHVHSMGAVPDAGPLRSCAASGQHLLRERRHLKTLWFPARGKAMHLNGQRPTSDCRPRVPRLCPIVPPSPWAQHHRPPCATPVACPPIAVGWTVPPPDHQQQLGGDMRPQSSNQAAKLVSTLLFILTYLKRRTDEDTFPVIL
jgi:hypothetical protein